MDNVNIYGINREKEREMRLLVENQNKLSNLN